MKSKENNLIWESYNNVSAIENNDDQVVIEFEPVGEMEPEIVHDGEHECGGEEESEIDTMVASELKKLKYYTDRLIKAFKHKDLEPWMFAKLIKASDYVSEIWHRLDVEADFANSGHEQFDNLNKFNEEL